MDLLDLSLLKVDLLRSKLVAGWSTRSKPLFAAEIVTHVSYPFPYFFPRSVIISTGKFFKGKDLLLCIRICSFCVFRRHFLQVFSLRPYLLKFFFRAVRQKFFFPYVRTVSRFPNCENARVRTLSRFPHCENARLALSAQAKRETERSRVAFCETANIRGLVHCNTRMPWNLEIRPYGQFFPVFSAKFGTDLSFRLRYDFQI